MQSKSIHLVALCLLQIVHASGNVCYLKGGQETSLQDSYTPCFSSDAQTHCCSSDWTCLSNGLCLVKWDTSINTGACTDPTWADSSCFQSCLEFSTLYRCDNNNWCCSTGGNTTSCCNDPNVAIFNMSGIAEIQNGTAFVPGYNIAASSDISTPKTSVATNTATSSLPSGTQPAQQTTASSHDRGSEATAAGLGAGLGVGIPLLLTIGGLLYLLCHEKKNNKDLRQRLSVEVSTPVPAYNSSDPLSKHREMSSTSQSRIQDQVDSVSELPHDSHCMPASELQS